MRVELRGNKEVFDRASTHLEVGASARRDRNRDRHREPRFADASAVRKDTVNRASLRLHGGRRLPGSRRKAMRGGTSAPVDVLVALLALDQPVLAEHTRIAGFTNLRAACGRYCFHKNVNCMWLLKQVEKQLCSSRECVGHPGADCSAGDKTPTPHGLLKRG